MRENTGEIVQSLLMAVAKGFVVTFCWEDSWETYYTVTGRESLPWAGVWEDYTSPLFRETQTSLTSLAMLRRRFERYLDQGLKYEISEK